jgi:hypothetical protein
MTSTPVVFLLKRSGLASDRPSGTIIQPGEPAVCFGAADPGVYFEDSAGSLRKVGPTHYGTSAPNSTPAGATGNSVGELWADNSTSAYYLKVWTGSSWQKLGAGFSDAADTATTATQASTAILASGTVLASGALFANTATLSSGSILASGVVKSSDIGFSGLPNPSSYGSGAFFYQIQPSGVYAAGLYIQFSNNWNVI